MILSVTQRPRARLDLLEQFVYFGEQAGVGLAERKRKLKQRSLTLGITSGIRRAPNIHLRPEICFS